MKKVLIATLLIFLTTLSAKEVKFTVFQLNDVYEITPVDGGKAGGFARIATLLNELKNENPNTISILAGDLFSPSAMGTVKIDGTALAGEQMVDLLNRMDWDYFTFGNHEFDIKEPEFRARVKEAKFKIFSANVFENGCKEMFTNTSRDAIFEVDGLKVGLVGVMMSSVDSKYACFKDPIEEAKKSIKELRQKGAEVIIAITHQFVEDDASFVSKVDGVDLVIGGHEHENMLLYRGSNMTPIAKADANAKSAYIHKFIWDTGDKTLKLTSNLKLLNETIKEEPKMLKFVEEWKDKTFKAFEKEGINPREVICKTTIALDGLEATVRNNSNELTNLIAKGVFNSYDGVDLAFYNSGAIRIDDILPAGEITGYDILRILPFGGEVLKISLSGATLLKAIENSEKNRGTGGFLQFSEIDKKEIDPKKEYIASVIDFLVTKGDVNLGFLTTETKIVENKHIDIREAFSKELKRKFPNK